MNARSTLTLAKTDTASTCRARTSATASTGSKPATTENSALVRRRYHDKTFSPWSVMGYIIENNEHLITGLSPKIGQISICLNGGEEEMY